MMQRIHFNGISKCVLLSLLCFSLSLFYFYSFAFFILSFCLCVSSVSVPTLLRVCVMHWNTETHIHAEHVLPAILQIPEKAAGVCSRGYSVAWVMAMSVCVTIVQWPNTPLSSSESEDSLLSSWFNGLPRILSLSRVRTIPWETGDGHFTKIEMSLYVEEWYHRVNV